MGPAAAAAAATIQHRTSTNGVQLWSHTKSRTASPKRLRHFLQFYLSRIVFVSERFRSTIENVLDERAGTAKKKTRVLLRSFKPAYEQFQQDKRET